MLPNIVSLKQVFVFRDNFHLSFHLCRQLLLWEIVAYLMFNQVHDINPQNEFEKYFKKVPPCLPVVNELTLGRILLKYNRIQASIHLTIYTHF